MNSEALWNRLEDLLALRVPSLRAALFSPASTAEIAETERAFGLQFPEQVRAAYLRHNGSSSADGCPAFFVPTGADWLTLDQARGRWKVMREVAESLSQDPYAQRLADVDVAGMVRMEFWNPKRIPVGSTLSEIHLFVDLMPGSTGSYGQLVKDYGMGEYTDESVAAPSFNEYLSLFADRLESGLLGYEAGRSWVNVKTGETILDWATMSGW